MLSQTLTVQSSLLNRAKIVGYLNHLVVVQFDKSVMI
jgi:hypothetical protein